MINSYLVSVFFLTIANLLAIGKGRRKFAVILKNLWEMFGMDFIREGKQV